MVLKVFSNPFVVWINILRRTVGVSKKKKKKTVRVSVLLILTDMDACVHMY